MDPAQFDLIQSSNAAVNRATGAAARAKRDSLLRESLLYVCAHRVSSNRALRWEAIWLCFSDG